MTRTRKLFPKLFRDFQRGVFASESNGLLNSWIYFKIGYIANEINGLGLFPRPDIRGTKGESGSREIGVIGSLYGEFS